MIESTSHGQKTKTVSFPQTFPLFKIDYLRSCVTVTEICFNIGVEHFHWIDQILLTMELGLWRIGSADTGSQGEVVPKRIIRVQQQWIDNA